jgi:hypothetical protein
VGAFDGLVRECIKEQLLLARDVRELQFQARVCSVADGFLVLYVEPPKAIDDAPCSVSVHHYSPPWKEPKVIPFDSAANVISASSNATGSRVATAELARMRIWDWSGGQLICLSEFQEANTGIAAISPSGNVVAYFTATEFVVVGVDSQQQILRLPAKPQHRIAFHPSEQWIAAGAGPFGLYSLADRPQWRELHVGGKHVPYAIPPRGQEYVVDVGFSRDGRWMWCGTSAGLRVYDWASVPHEPDSDLLNPRYSFNPPARADSQFATYIHSIVEEIDTPAIVFAGISESLYRLDLSDGTVRELARLPGVGAIHQLVMSHDGTTLGLSGRAPGPPNLLGHQKSIWNIWSYPKLRG